MTTLAALTIRDLDPAAAPERRQVLIDRLAVQAETTDRYLLLRAALDAAFPHGPLSDGTAFTGLHPDQRSIVAELRRSGVLSDGAMTSMLLSTNNVPDDEAAMAAWCDGQ